MAPGPSRSRLGAICRAALRLLRLYVLTCCLLLSATAVVALAQVDDAALAPSLSARPAAATAMPLVKPRLPPPPKALKKPLAIPNLTLVCVPVATVCVHCWSQPPQYPFWYKVKKPPPFFSSFPK